MVEEPTASRTHLMLKLKNNRLKIIDLGSSNGTKVNEVAIQTNEWIKIKFGD
jgi:pSer/pThr/pTyr-binding forkhead associated (FHA) protein